MAMRLHTVRSSKLGHALGLSSSSDSCPPSCTHHPDNLDTCYAHNGRYALHWRRLDRRYLVDELDAVIAGIHFHLPRTPGRLFRMAPVGDMPGLGEHIDLGACIEVLHAVDRVEGTFIAYTHRRDDDTFRFAEYAMERGHTVNFSTESVEECDALMDAGYDVALVVDQEPGSDWGHQRPGKHVGVQCLAERKPGVCCLTCTKRPLCARPRRKAYIGLTPHANRKHLLRRSLSVL